MFTDPTGEFFFSLFLGPLGAIIDAACWGAVIGGATYTASVAMSNGGFSNWSWNSFWSSAGLGAVSGVATAGIGNMFGPVGGNFTKFGDIVGHELGRAFTHGVANGYIAGVTGGDPLSAFTAGGLGSLAGSAFSAYAPDFARSPVGQLAFGAVSGGVGAELTGSDFWQGAAIGLMTTGLNHMQQEVKLNMQIRKYVETMFPDRIPEGADVKFKLFNEQGGLTKANPSNHSKLDVSISRKSWLDKDNRYLIDIIDHELVHVDDYASGRVLRYAQKYNLVQQEAIMEYKAYSQNQWYNINMRQPGMRIDYSKVIDTYRRQLPYEW
jgi:hypothetical protein